MFSLRSSKRHPARTAAAVALGASLALAGLAACSTPSANNVPDAGGDAESPAAVANASGAVAAGMSFPKNSDGFADITVEQLASMMPNKDFTLVNVHVPYGGELPETDLFIQYDQISSQLDALPARDAPIVIYCRSGNMSTQSASELASLGYTNVMELDGGFNAWGNAGYQVLSQPQ